MVNKRKDFNRWAVLAVKKALWDYQMIQSGEHLAVGLSGGKDSGTLLWLLSEVRRITPLKFKLEGIFLDLGFGLNPAPLAEFCHQLDIPFRKIKTNIAEIVFDLRQESNPCSLCANLRRGALHNAALEAGCSKAALGHHLDDVIETFLMSWFYTGQFKTFEPNTYLDHKNIHLLRPMIYLKQEEVQAIADSVQVPVLVNPCPANGNSKREEIRQLLTALKSRYPDLQAKTLHALQNLDLKNLWPSL